MLLFKRILNFKKTAAAPEDKRKAQRYPVGAAFPFKAVLTLLAHDEAGSPMDDPTRTQAWGGRLTDLSETGANIHLSAAAMARKGESCLFKLSVDDYLLEFPGTIAHFRVHLQHASCGFYFNFPSAEIVQSYMQVLEPVSIV